MTWHKRCLHTLHHHNTTLYLPLLNELLDDHLESTEWLLLVGNPASDYPGTILARLWKQSVTLYVHLFSGPDNLEWSMIRHTSPFAKTFHVDGITKLHTLQTSLAFLLHMCVPLLQLIHDLWREERSTYSGYGLHFCTCFEVSVNPRWLRQRGSPKTAESTKQSSFCVTLLRATLVRESTSQESCCDLLPLE